MNLKTNYSLISFISINVFYLIKHMLAISSFSSLLSYLYHTSIHLIFVYHYHNAYNHILNFYDLSLSLLLFWISYYYKYYYNSNYHKFHKDLWLYSIYYRVIHLLFDSKILGRLKESRHSYKNLLFLSSILNAKNTAKLKKKASTHIIRVMAPYITYQIWLYYKHNYESYELYINFIYTQQTYF